MTSSGASGASCAMVRGAFFALRKKLLPFVEDSGGGMQWIVALHTVFVERVVVSRFV
jgi:hypothetical protein